MTTDINLPDLPKFDVEAKHSSEDGIITVILRGPNSSITFEAAPDADELEVGLLVTSVEEAIAEGLEALAEQVSND